MPLTVAVVGVVAAACASFVFVEVTVLALFDVVFFVVAAGHAGWLSQDPQPMTESWGTGLQTKQQTLSQQRLPLKGTGSSKIVFRCSGHFGSQLRDRPRHCSPRPECGINLPGGQC